MAYTIKIELYSTHAGLHVADVYRVPNGYDAHVHGALYPTISRSGTWPDAAAEGAIAGYRAVVARERAESASAKNEPVYTATNNELNYQARVFAGAKTGYTVTIFDLDSKQTLAAMRRFNALDLATSYADQIAKS